MSNNRVMVELPPVSLLYTTNTPEGLKDLVDEQVAIAEKQGLSDLRMDVYAEENYGNMEINMNLWGYRERTEDEKVMAKAHEDKMQDIRQIASDTGVSFIDASLLYNLAKEGKIKL